VAAVGDPFYKITSEALLVCQQLAIVIRPLGLYLHAVLIKTSASVDCFSENLCNMYTTCEICKTQY